MFLKIQQYDSSVLNIYLVFKKMLTKIMHFYDVIFGSYSPLATSIIIYFIPCKNMTHLAYAITVKVNDH